LKISTFMNNLIRYSSITKKIVMSLAGLFLALFLCVHLIINLTLLRGDGGGMYMWACDFMTTNIVIKIFEVVLFGGFLLHIIFGLIVTFKNWVSRPVGYLKSNKSQTSFFSRYMFHTGAIIFIFLLLHFINFYFVKLGWVNAPGNFDKHDFYHMAIFLFSNKLYSLIYIAFFVFLGFHLNHSIQSGFQTLGMNHDKYTPFIKAFSAVYAIIIAVGFITIPVYFMFFFN
jgi:succinate dehydrogenase / fumarate reductase, cytochrome b subunit